MSDQGMKELPNLVFMQHLNDQVLLFQLKKENDESYKLLYQFYFPSILKYITLNRGSREDAEDVFQEAIIVLVKKVRDPGFVLNSSLKTYLYAISKNLWLKRLRDSKHIPENYSDLILLEKEAVGFEVEIVEAKSKEEQLQDWLLKITDNCQRVLKAIYFYQVSMKSLMSKMGWKNKHTADNQKYKCIQQIKRVKEMEKRENLS